jgi:hypothetical protein
MIYTTTPATARHLEILPVPHRSRTESTPVYTVTAIHQRRVKLNKGKLMNNSELFTKSQSREKNPVGFRRSS